MHSFCIYGDLSKEDILFVLRQQYPLKTVHVYDMDESEENKYEFIHENRNRRGISETFEGTFMTTTPNLIDSLKYEIEIRDKEIKSLEEHNLKSLEDLRMINAEHEKLLEDFTVLRQKYDEKKQALLDVLWTQCSKYHPELSSIPRLQTTDGHSIESGNTVGDFILGATLGDGKYGTVKSCQHCDTGAEYAVKIVSKDKITTVTALRRLSKEIEILKLLRSPNIVSLEQTLQTKKNLYMFMEKGGPDLFELINMYPNGLCEDWSKEIMKHVVKAVKACHQNHVCHRDLKPENILLEFNPMEGKVISLKLCDFGLSQDMKTKTLTDLCGSPGFIAPEMILREEYHGDKADIWSFGCVLLELMLGHDDFCDRWVSAYNHSILQNKQKFSLSISNAINRLQTILPYSTNFNNVVLQCLKLDPTQRPSIFELSLHPCLRDDSMVVDSGNSVQVFTTVTTLKMNLQLPPLDTSLPILGCLSNDSILSSNFTSWIDGDSNGNSNPPPNHHHHHHHHQCNSRSNSNTNSSRHQDTEIIDTDTEFSPSKESQNDVSSIDLRRESIFRLPNVVVPRTPDFQHNNRSSLSLFSSSTPNDRLTFNNRRIIRLNSGNSDVSGISDTKSIPRMNSEEFPSNYPEIRSRTSLIRETICRLNDKL